MKEDIAKFVGKIKLLFVLLSVIAIPAIMICFVFAWGGIWYFWFIGSAVLVVYFIIYGLYALRISMGVVLGVEVTDKVIHLHTKRKTFTYDAKYGCKAVKVFPNRFVATFEAQDSRDNFTFYRHLPFKKYSAELFTEAEIDQFYPLIVG